MNDSLVQLEVKYFCYFYTAASHLKPNTFKIDRDNEQCSGELPASSLLLCFSLVLQWEGGDCAPSGKGLYPGAVWGITHE